MNQSESSPVSVGKRSTSSKSIESLRPPEAPLALAPIVPISDVRALGETVADAIVNAVAQGLLQPGQRLIEADLASQFEISRVPVREAIKMLQAQGIVKATPNQGTRVAPFDGLVIDQVIEARVALERIAVRDAAVMYSKDPRLLDQLREIVARMHRAAKWSDWAELRKSDIAFHHEMCRASGNEVVLNLWKALARRTTIIFGRELASERDFDVVIRQHEDMVNAFERGGDSVERMIENHIFRLRKPASMTSTSDGCDMSTVKS
jgi:DNA-binding GntR family transcriptional regulator